MLCECLCCRSPWSSCARAWGANAARQAAESSSTMERTSVRCDSEKRDRARRDIVRVRWRGIRSRATGEHCDSAQELELGIQRGIELPGEEAVGGIAGECGTAFGDRGVDHA